eukprot:2364313-Prymnesium_polylepis.1
MSSTRGLLPRPLSAESDPAPAELHARAATGNKTAVPLRFCAPALLRSTQELPAVAPSDGLPRAPPQRPPPPAA